MKQSYLLFDALKLQLSEYLLQLPLFQQEALRPTTLNDIYAALNLPPQASMGDYALSCFVWAKALKKSPASLAQDLVQNWQEQIQKKPLAIVQSVQVAGPYVNFTFTTEALAQTTLVDVLSESFFKQKFLQQSLRTMIEYSQPNTHKELHVGHTRNLCLGASLVYVLKYLGHPVVTSTFPGDVGTHVAKCLWYMKYHNLETIPADKKGEWLGRMYSKAHLKLEDELGTDQEATNRQQLTEILKQLHDQKGEFFDLWKVTRQWSIDLMQSVYDWFGVKFDHWYWESDVDADSVRWVKDLQATGKLQISEGAVGLDLSADKLGFCLLLKSDGTGLYATKDLELARRKFQDHQIEKSIYIVDLRQELHFKQVFKVLQKLGFSQAQQCFHLHYNYVELPDGAMSSRKGNIVPLMTLVDRMQEHIIQTYLKKHTGWTSQEVQRVAHQVARGAIAYGMLRMDTNKKIVFQLEDWLRLDGDSGPFIQYSCARILSLYRKIAPELGWPVLPEATAEDIFGSAKAFCAESSELKFALLQHATERQLMQHMLNFNTVVATVADQYKPSILCTYLYDLAKLFNVFYHECSIGMAESTELKKARLLLSVSVGLVLQKGLGLLGIPVPDKM